MTKFLSLIFLSSSLFTFAETLESNYPELMVVPRASSRVKSEAMRERKSILRKLSYNWTISTPALFTLMAGINQKNNHDAEKDPEKNSSKVAIALGATWLIAHSLLTYNYKPHLKTYRSYRIRKNKKISLREELMIERMSEERINKMSALATRLKWISFSTHFASSLYLLGNQKKDSSSETTNILALAASFIPLLFPLRWAETKENHDTSKKRIYGPLVRSTLFQLDGKWSPGILLSLNF